MSVEAEIAKLAKERERKIAEKERQLQDIRAAIDNRLKKIAEIEAELAILREELASGAPERVELTRCPEPCGKRSFRSEKAAMKANITNDKSLRPYYNVWCRCWHVAKAEW